MKPEAGQWWFRGILRRFVVGRTHRGIVVEAGTCDEHGLGYVHDDDWSHWHHEPRCTGWDWVVPEQPQPAEDPDEWVILDPVKYADHVPRTGIDWFMDGKNAWVLQASYHDSRTVGDHFRWCDKHHRCRRRDLPKVEPERVVEPQKPLQISLGEGRVAITCFSDDTGRGVIFRDTGIDHPIGSFAGEPPESLHNPMPGEIYIHCKNKQSAIVLIEQMQEVVRQFEAEQWPSSGDSKTCEWLKIYDRYVSDGDWKQLTEAEAMALLRPTSNAYWSYHEKHKPQPQKTRVRLWMHYIGGTVICGSRPSEGWQEIHHDAKGFYVEG